MKNYVKSIKQFDKESGNEFKQFKLNRSIIELF